MSLISNCPRFRSKQPLGKGGQSPNWLPAHHFQFYLQLEDSSNGTLCVQIAFQVPSGCKIIINHLNSDSSEGNLDPELYFCSNLHLERATFFSNSNLSPIVFA
ncbi:hypothetical protein TNCT_315811 [Trichonephila clavata]|uniref:Uncharacterized protein n=1 Tax=Trichonephila clavata TaxID=2740835 RepID=A0A8X6FSG2_TRICU|nr:hypothetical protein TNCT_315811 [Trichonephila clavata]